MKTNKVNIKGDAMLVENDEGTDHVKFQSMRKRLNVMDKGQVSQCCNAKMKIGGDGIGEGSTHYYVCLECLQPCDPK